MSRRTGSTGDGHRWGELTVGQFHRVGEAVGIPASGLARRAELLGRHIR